VEFTLSAKHAINGSLAIWSISLPRGRLYFRNIRYRYRYRPRLATLRKLHNGYRSAV